MVVLQTGEMDGWWVTRTGPGPSRPAYRGLVPGRGPGGEPARPAHPPGWSQDACAINSVQPRVSDRCTAAVMAAAIMPAARVPEGCTAEADRAAFGMRVPPGQVTAWRPAGSRWRGRDRVAGLTRPG